MADTDKKPLTVEQQLGEANRREGHLRSVINEMKRDKDASFERIINLAAERDEFKIRAEGLGALVEMQAKKIAELMTPKTPEGVA